MPFSERDSEAHRGTLCSWGADTAANDLRAVARLLEGYEDKSVEAFITDTKESLDRLVERESLPAPLGDELVAIHSNRLLAAGIDQEQMRFVTHNDVSREDCGKVLEVVRGICR